MQQSEHSIVNSFVAFCMHIRVHDRTFIDVSIVKSGLKISMVTNLILFGEVDVADVKDDVIIRLIWVLLSLLPPGGLFKNIV